MYAKKYNATSQTWQPTGKLWGTKSSDLTLPATIYCDGSNITTYTIKGNTVQDGTPTPDNPIMPQGCGDLETVGAKAGQYKIPISSASTTTPVYLGEVETTRRIKKLVLTGTESWSYYPSNAPFKLNLTEEIRLPLSTTVFWVCSHYEAVSNSASWTSYDSCISWSTNDRRRSLRFRDIRYSNLADFKAYIAQQYANGTPVTIWYVLATETTGIVNEPLQKIGDYADSITSSQAGVSIPTVAGDNTISVDTTVQPSEFTATWTGWHELVGKVFDGTDWI